MRVAVLTSGGDAPGMNAAVRAVVRLAASRGWEVHGVRHGYAGLVREDLVPLGVRDVGGIVGRGGTMLGSARCPEFHRDEIRAAAVRMLADRGIEALIVIGGNGSQAGAEALVRLGMRVVGIASTIDNDLHGSEPTIGATTAVDVALESIDRLRTTAASHDRVFLVEVMGRGCGYLALLAGITGGAEAIVVPELATDVDQVAAELREARERGKSHAIVVVAEGAEVGIDALTQHLADSAFEVRATRLGHVQRGAAPNAFDRMLATRLGVRAIETLAAGGTGVLIGWLRGDVAETPLAIATAAAKAPDPALLALAATLAR